jgi:hypothetical protein
MKGVPLNEPSSAGDDHKNQAGHGPGQPERTPATYYGPIQYVRAAQHNAKCHDVDDGPLPPPQTRGEGCCRESPSKEVDQSEHHEHCQSCKASDRLWQHRECDDRSARDQPKSKVIPQAAIESFIFAGLVDIARCAHARNSIQTSLASLSANAVSQLGKLWVSHVAMAIEARMTTFVRTRWQKSGLA